MPSAEQHGSSHALPDDVAQAEAERAAYLAKHKAALPLAELPLVEVEDDRLARVLGELGRAVEVRAAQRAAQAAQAAGADRARASEQNADQDRLYPSHLEQERESGRQGESSSTSLKEDVTKN